MMRCEAVTPGVSLRGARGGVEGALEAISWAPVDGVFRPASHPMNSPSARRAL